MHGDLFIDVIQQHQNFAGVQELPGVASDTQATGVAIGGDADAAAVL